LEISGFIDKYIAILNPRKAGYSCFTFVEVKLARHGETPVENFISSIALIPEVLECHHITGEADFLLKVVTKDIPAYEELILHQLSALTNVQTMKTSVVLSTFKNETKLTV
ncbi:MAG: Lrp/AsnC family transcriptional regulator, partial [Candidatus Marinimicrobia bacterium]|nr:Lrp/AsnC family transcriptional regulator [Candidatus Neomarinimicrobiota bacterium]